MFTEKFNTLWKELNIQTDLEFSRYLNCERSYVNRMRRGDRVPGVRGKTAERLVDGFYLYAQDHDKEKELLKILKIDGDLKELEVKRRIREYLFEIKYTSTMLDKNGKTYSVNYRAGYKMRFGEKLSAVMKCLEITNVKLAKMVNLDASVISRYKNGVTMPKKNSDIADVLCERLLQYTKITEREENLQKLTGFDNYIFKNEKVLSVMFHKWMFDSYDEDISIVKNMIDSFKSVNSQAINQNYEVLQEKMKILDCIEDDIGQSKSVYHGNEGLRQAVLRFLNGVRNGNVKEILLYSDENMNWMTDDEEFIKKWMLLMLACVQKGVLIRIIHNIDRGPKEMTDAIKSWLPLYMSGLIESYYAQRTGGERFSHTLFIAKGVGCISSWNAKNVNDKNIYFYDVEDEEIEFFENIFNSLLKESKRLVKVNVGESIPKDDKEYSGFKEWNIPGLRIILRDRSVSIIKDGEVPVEFNIGHPYMVMAFKNYLDK